MLGILGDDSFDSIKQAVLAEVVGMETAGIEDVGDVLVHCTSATTGVYVCSHTVARTGSLEEGGGRREGGGKEES